MLCLQSQKEYKFKLILLDDREFKFLFKGTQKCEQILIDISKILSLEERKYFNFKYYNSDHQLQWTNLNKSIHSQFKSIHVESGDHEIIIYFCVKYYLTDPCKLAHELTRYLFYLQLRKDIANGRLPVQFDYAVDLFGYFLQDELGDFNSKRDVDGYAAEYEFMPNQTIELEKSAAAKHLKLKGMSQAVVEINFLNKAKWLDMYGVDMHTVFDEENDACGIGLTPTGVTVFKNNVKTSSYFWPRIKKVNYRGNKLILTIIDKLNDEKNLTFYLNCKSACKNLWKSCVDQHEFFKLKTVYEEPARINTALVTKSNKAGVPLAPEANVYIKRVPAKRIKRTNELLKGLGESKSQTNVREQQVNQINNMLFENRQTRREADNSDSPEQSPSASTKSISSYKQSRRRESASETEHNHRRKHNTGRNRSKTRRSTANEDSGGENGDKNPNQETEDSDTNLLKQNTASSKPVHRSSSNTSTGSRRHRSSHNGHHHHHHRRADSRNSNKLVNVEFTEQYVVSEARIIRNKSKKSLNNQQSGTNLIQGTKPSASQHHHHQHGSAFNAAYDQSETCHETSMDEAERNNAENAERKRQVRRRKRSKSPGGTAIMKPPEEILQHIKYDLIQSSGMSADQLKEIPFVKIETSAPPFRISPHQKHRRFSPHRRKSGEFQETKSGVVAYVRDGTAQIARTNKKLLEDGDATLTDMTGKLNSISIAQAANSKLNRFGEVANNGFSADSGCEDMVTR